MNTAAAAGLAVLAQQPSECGGLEHALISCHSNLLPLAITAVTVGVVAAAAAGVAASLLFPQLMNAVTGVNNALGVPGPGGPPDAGMIQTTADTRPRLQQFGHSLPDPRTLSFGYGPDGLIDSINGIPVNDYLQDLSRQRNDLYRQMQSNRTKLPDGTRIEKHFTKKKTGSMHSVLFDRRTGEFFEADNRTLEYEQPTDLHPTLQERLDRMDQFAQQNSDHYLYRDGTRGGFPHPDIPGTHSEVAAANQALRAREAAGHPAGPEAMRELVVDNRRLFGGGAGSQAKCCANCTSILGDIQAIPGKKTEF